MMESALYYNWPDLMMNYTFEEGGDNLGELADLFEVYETKDGGVVLIIIANDEIFNKFKAFIGWPGVFFIFKEKRIKIIKMHIDKSENEELLEEKSNSVFHVTRNGLLSFQNDKMIVITHLQFENKNIIGPKDIYNSYKKFFQ